MQKIFSDMDISKIEKDASDAYKTLGMSASEYLAVINDVGASFSSTMGDEAGYEAAKKGLTAISDYASGTGKSFDELQQKLAMITRSTSSYQSIADQFSGILPATSEGFLQQAQAAGILSTEYQKLTDVPIEEYQKAVTDMLALGVDTLNLTGNTAAEASTTLSGSVSAMSSAWNNLVTGIADDDANFDQLINNFVDSAGAVAENLLPRVEVALEGLGELVEQLLPVIVERIPELVETVLPGLLQSGINMLLTIAEGIVSALPMLAETAYNLVTSLLTGITENSGSMIGSGVEVLSNFIIGIAEKLPELMNMAVEAIISFAMALTDPNTLTNIIEAGISLLLALTGGLVDAIPSLLGAIPVIIGRLIAALVANAPRLVIAAIEMLVQLGAFLVQSVGELLTFIPEVATSIIDAFIETDWAQIGQNILDGIWDGISAGWDWLTGKVGEVANSLFGAAQDELEIHSPSRKFKWLAEMCIAGFDEPMEDFNPYETLHNSMKMNVSGMQASFARMTPTGTQEISRGGYNQTIIVEQPISTPDELARAVRAETKLGLVTG